MKKSVSIILLATILLQSCVAYQKTSVSINEAYDSGKVKITDSEGKNKKYMNIIMKDSIYYGVREWRKVPLDTTLISKIYLEDIEKSKKINSALVGASVAFAVLIICGLIVLGTYAIIKTINDI